MLMERGEGRDEATFGKRLGESLNEPGRLDLVATIAGPAGECIVGRALGEREVSTRMQHNAFANVNVLRSHWGRGIGRQLAAAIDQWAREQNLRRLTGMALAHNTRALRFATAAGYREEFVSPRSPLLHRRP